MSCLLSDYLSHLTMIHVDVMENQTRQQNMFILQPNRKIKPQILNAN